MNNSTGSPPRPLRLGIVGPGRFAAYLAPSIGKVDEIRLWSVYSRSAERAAAFATAHGAGAPKPAHDDYAAFLADPELDAVLVATPDGLHAAHALQAIRAGKHVFIEKPMTTARADALALLREARANGVRLAVGYNYRWHAGHRLLRRKIVSGELGEIHHASVVFPFAPTGVNGWRSHGAEGRWWCLGAAGTHAIDLMDWMLTPACGSIRRIRAVTRSGTYGARDEAATLILEFENGATATVFASLLLRGETTLDVLGGKSRARADDTLAGSGGGRILVGGEALPYSPVNPYAAELADFAAAVRERRDPEVGGEIGLRNVDLLLMTEEAGRSHGI